MPNPELPSRSREELFARFKSSPAHRLFEDLDREDRESDPGRPVIKRTPVVRAIKKQG